MTKEQNEYFVHGIIVGIIINFLFIVVIFMINMALHPEDRYTPSALLNDPEWYIDTVKTIHQGDTIETYRFAKFKKCAH